MNFGAVSRAVNRSALRGECIAKQSQMRLQLLKAARGSNQIAVRGMPFNGERRINGACRFEISGQALQAVRRSPRGSRIIALKCAMQIIEQLAAVLLEHIHQHGKQLFVAVEAL